MKKFIVMMLLAIAVSASITSCTEDEVAPTHADGGGGNGSADGGF
jgi:hypothetical protein